MRQELGKDKRERLDQKKKSIRLSVHKHHNKLQLLHRIANIHYFSNNGRDQNISYNSSHYTGFEFTRTNFNSQDFVHQTCKKYCMRVKNAASQWKKKFAQSRDRTGFPFGLFYTVCQKQNGWFIWPFLHLL